MPVCVSARHEHPLKAQHNTPPSPPLDLNARLGFIHSRPHVSTRRTQNLPPWPQIVDKTIMYADQDGDGKVSFDEFCEVVGNSEVEVDMNLPSDAI